MPANIQVKTILNKTKRRDDWFLDDYTINPYSGCSFNCLFCYTRGSKYGLNMEEKLSVKNNAVELLDKQLRNRAKKNQFGFIVLSSSTDPYLHFERDYGLTRKLLDVILHYRFPVHIITRSDLITRDFDLLSEISKKAIIPEDLQQRAKQGAFLTFSFSTVDQVVASRFEPGATKIELRLKAMKAADADGFKTGVSMMPLLPYISDTTSSLETMFSTFKAHGAGYILPATLTLFGNEATDSKTLVMKAVEKNYPELLPKYVKLFNTGSELPEYYRKAFNEKMLQLGEKFGIRLRI